MEDKDKNKETISRVGSGGFMDPDKVVENLKIEAGYKVADFGCGAGYLTIPIAKRVLNSGKVYAIDVLNEPLEAVMSKAKLYGLLNIEPMRANVETVGGTKISDKSVDLGVLANILFQCNDYDSVFMEAKRILKKSGKIAVIDWLPEDVQLGPKFEHCLKKDFVKKIAIKNGFKFEKDFDAGKHHYGMIFSLI